MTGRRPKPKARLLIDPDNAYARLGVSPLASTDEIKAFINDRRSKALSRRRSQGREVFGAEDVEITRLQELEEEIGSARARAAYDQEHPQNELLTVQPSPRDRALEPRQRAQLAAAWLREELGPDTLLRVARVRGAVAAGRGGSRAGSRAASARSRRGGGGRARGGPEAAGDRGPGKAEELAWAVITR